MEEPTDISEGSDMESSNNADNAELSNVTNFPDENEPKTLNENKCDTIDEQTQDSEINDNECISYPQKIRKRQLKVRALKEVFARDDINMGSQIISDLTPKSNRKRNHALQDPLKLNNSDSEGKEMGANSHKEILNSTDTIIIQSDSESEINDISNKSKDKENQSKDHNNHNLDKNKKKSDRLSLRRSSRAVSKIVYDEDTESEEEPYVEEAIKTPPIERHTKNNPSNIKNAVLYANNVHKHSDLQIQLPKSKEPGLLILDSNHNNPLRNSIVTSQKNNKGPKVSANIYNKMASQGTTITLINGKNTPIPIQPEPRIPQPPILLPSLTDDMFVVEAPSFIVPYVYEKPSIKHFRKFVDDLGKEVEEELKKNAKKEENEKDNIMDNEKNEEMNKDKDNESTGYGIENENVIEKRDESQPTLLPNIKSKRRQRNQGDDDKSWDGDSLSGSDSDGGRKIEVIKTKDITTDDIKKLTQDVNCNKTVAAKCESYFTCSLGQFFMNIARLEPPPAYNECPNCPYEDNRKNKFAKHLLACNRKFKPEINLIPPLDWEPPAKIPKIVQQPKSYLGYQKAANYSQLQMTKTYNQNPYLLQTNSVNKTIQTIVPLQSATLMQNNLMLQNPVTNVAKRMNQPIVNNIQNKTSMLPKLQSAPNPPSISIIPLPRQSVPSLPVQAPAVKPKETYVTCEICDGFIQNLEMLRSHLQWIHQIKVHPKLMQNRPPLNCQKCQFRFFTDQGLERHLLGSHGLVTTSMQEASDAGKDSGRCPICGRVFNWSLLSHVAKDHYVTLKPAHLSYKCTVCTATFSQYKQFENHVYSSHSTIARLTVDKNKSTPALQKQINIINQPSTSMSKGK
ncbi:MOG interacting and ectopic P-granules protein 1 [Eumeta japonica]|uniref:MOG interacting and ectopic P-granules protein 1 n=1 Tax=Eumeta variegata TaxID=151549 RepID=A0A4C1V858_EUMVA|nr:MOG interacting and ectopic P-granules protein 1 [Eumeta japonica]